SVLLLRLSCWAGFAAIEDMLYESAGTHVWAGLAVLRGIGGILHPLNAGLVALGWYGVRNGHPGAWRRLAGYFGLAVAIHALWNGAMGVLFSDVGAHFFGAERWTLNIYNVGQPGVVIVFMLLETILLWQLLVRVSAGLRASKDVDDVPLPPLRRVSPRKLAIYAAVAVAVATSLGALYGPLVQNYSRHVLPFG
ncbi:MAG: hypothetical protein DLM70_05910, partial [Chloroflexi bacterium]